MIKTLIAAAAFVAVAAPAIAQEQPVEQRFERDGATYVFTRTDTPGKIVLRGRRLSPNTPFRFTIAGKRVTGFVDNAPVSFNLNDVQHRTEIAAR